MTDSEYSFESFLPYRQALQLARMVSGLLRLELGMRRGCRNFDETLVSGISFNARAIFPDIKPPGMGEDEFREVRQREEEERAMNEEERGERIEKMAEDLRRSIEKGEIDIWDDTPRFVDADKVAEFRDNSLRKLTESLTPSLKPGAGLLADLTREAVGSVAAGTGDILRGYRGGLVAWDFARMHHEGEPPYKIAFSRQVAEALGLDPVLEGIRAARIPKPTARDRSRMRAALSLVESGIPELHGRIQEAMRTARLL
jgi:hypothetical protein